MKYCKNFYRTECFECPIFELKGTQHDKVYDRCLSCKHYNGCINCLLSTNCDLYKKDTYNKLLNAIRSLENEEQRVHPFTFICPVYNNTTYSCTDCTMIYNCQYKEEQNK